MFRVEILWILFDGIFSTRPFWVLPKSQIFHNKSRFQNKSKLSRQFMKLFLVRILLFIAIKYICLHKNANGSNNNDITKYIRKSHVSFKTKEQNGTLWVINGLYLKLQKTYIIACKKYSLFLSQSFFNVESHSSYRK